VHRQEMRATLSRLLHLLMKKNKPHNVLPLAPRVISGSAARVAGA